MIPFNSYFKNILAKYPRLDNDEIISGIYTFLNTIKIKHPNAHLGTYPSTDTTYHKVSILDENNRILGDISFKAYSNGNYGIVFSLNNREFAIKVSDEGHIDLRCDYPLCGFNTGTDEVANTKYVLDAINYKNGLLNNSITEYVQDSLDILTDAVGALRVKTDNLVGSISLDGDNLLAKNLNQETISTVSLSSLISSININAPSFIWSRHTPINMTTLFSGNLDNGDINLSEAFTNFDVLFFMFGNNDATTSSKAINLETCRFIPVWILDNLVNSKALFGVSANTCNLLDACEGHYWQINLNNSTTTKLAFNGDNRLRLWKVIGFKYANDTETND